MFRIIVNIHCLGDSLVQLFVLVAQLVSISVHNRGANRPPHDFTPVTLVRQLFYFWVSQLDCQDSFFALLIFDLVLLDLKLRQLDHFVGFGLGFFNTRWY